MRRSAFFAVSAAAVLTISACSSSTMGPSDSSASGSGAHNHNQMDATAIPTNGETTSTVNGKVPPNKPTKLTDTKTLLDAPDGQGNITYVYKGVRPAGTRSPIHSHPYGGTTCVISGEMTLYLEGAEPQRATAGQCYYMPSGKSMSGVNSGTGPAVLHDIFTVPEGTPVWTVLEPGQADKSKNFGTDPG